MRWHDEAIILNIRPHGETSAIVEVMSREHGRHQGRVQGGRTRRWQAALQMGNRANVEWWARLDEHLGNFKLEICDFVAARLMDQPLKLYAIQTMCSHLRLLGERDPHPELYEGLNLMLDHGEDLSAAAEILARFELRLLSSLGVGLDLRVCAATGKCEDLTYVSPRTGRAVSQDAGIVWHDKLLILPQFLLNPLLRPGNIEALIQAFDLTGFFLARHVWEPRALKPPLMRPRYLQHLNAALKSL